MADSEGVVAGRFKKGADPRRHTNGRKSKDAVAFGAAFSNALATKGKPEELAKILWEEARRKKPWAIEMVMERLMGKVTQPIDANENVVFRVIYDKSAAEKDKA